MASRLTDGTLSRTPGGPQKLQAPISVMTFNVGNGLATPARMVALLRQVGADIVGLQEVAVGQAHALERDLSGMYPYQLLTSSGFSGKGLLSRYPLVEGERLSLYPGRPDLKAAVDVGGLKLR